MKSAGAIKHKLKQVRFRYMKLHLEEHLKMRPGNCAHNSVFMHPLANGEPVGVCLKSEVQGASNNLPICDSKWADRASECPYFATTLTKDQYKEGFGKRLESLSLPEIARDYPDMAALLWVLGEDTVEDAPEVAPVTHPVSPIGDADPGIMGTDTVGSEPPLPLRVEPGDTVRLEDTYAVVLPPPVTVTGTDGRSLTLEPDGSSVVTEPSGGSFKVAAPISEESMVESTPWWSRLLSTMR